MADTKLSNTLVNDTSEGTIAYAEQIKDVVRNKFQSEINTDILTEIATLKSNPGEITVTVDQTLNSSSTNAVSNKAVTNALNSKLSSVPDATDMIYGVVKLGKSGVVTGNNVYPVQLYSNNTMEGENPGGLAVYVPWENTKYTLPTATSSKLGGIKVGTGLSISNGVLSVTSGTTNIDWSNITGKPDIPAIISRVGTLESTIGNSNSGLIKEFTDYKIDINHNRIEDIESSLSNLSSDVNNLTTDVNANTSGLSSYGDRITRLEERISALITRVNNLESQ